MNESSLAIFEGSAIRRHFDKSEEKWLFSVVDVIAVLTESANPRDYWFKMKIRVKSEDGIELSTICRQLKMIASDGKMRMTDCTDVQGILRIVQSVPSPKAEPFMQWLAKVGYERIQDMGDPALSVDRARNLCGERAVIPRSDAGSVRQRCSTGLPPLFIQKTTSKSCH